MSIAQFTIDLMKTSIFWVNEQGIIENVNSSSCRALGYQRLELLGMSIMQIDPKLKNSIWKQYWKAIKEVEKTDFETEYFTKTGQAFPVKIEAFFADLEAQYVVLRAKDWTISSRYQQLFEVTEQVAKIGAWDWNLETNEILNTKEIYNIYDLEMSGQLNPDIIFQSFEGEDLKRLEQAIENTRQHKTPIDLILNFTSSKGKEKIVHLSAIPKIFNNKVVKLQGILEDVTHEKLSERQAYLKDITIESINEMIFWAGLDGQFFFVNNAVVETLGYTKEEMYEKYVWDIVLDYPKEQWLENAQKLKESKYTRFHTTHQRKNGSTYPTDTSLTYLQYEGKEYICAIVRNEEANHARQVQKNKMEQQAQLTTKTFQQVGDIILWTQPEDGKLLYFNEAVENQLGYTKEEFYNIKSSDLIANYNPKEQVAYRKTLGNKKNFIGECILTRKDGTKMITELKSSVVQYGDRKINCSIFRDISARKKREEKLQSLLDENLQLKETLEAENAYLNQELSLNHNFEDIISTSPKYAAVLSKIENVADTGATVLITGETGTGKELLARAVHHLSNRNDRPLVKINCAALPENLIESELFGHEKGAFTGAVARKIGRFELANGATLFLDEIGELSLELQPKLLRVLQEGEFSRLGGNKTHKTDVRIIAATNRDLSAMVEAGTFREDLFYRLNVYPIHNIPLRERKEDIPLLVKYFLKKFNDRIGRKVSKVSAKSLSTLRAYDYPGNIRELENIIERAVITSKSETLNLSQWKPEKEMLSIKEEIFPTLEEIERQHIIEALKLTNWKVSGKGGAAELLAINSKTLDSRMRKLNIKRADYMIQ